ncbi:hypothetical protein T07_12182 [Trichinella nelsoni]|uniref:Uncharacterized protein n=1 Tax=Trichinella nelsoni TaxID=6336 RepID=A0A0V0S669_9BILA|nr:hypothetical protein T07_12182 [Trichinella nelsoni]
MRIAFCPSRRCVQVKMIHQICRLDLGELRPMNEIYVESKLGLPWTMSETNEAQPEVALPTFSTF